ncbi:MAG: hypothetical protein WDN45_12800 [Caulobacteraceae bacterium]
MLLESPSVNDAPPPQALFEQARGKLRAPVRIDPSLLAIAAAAFFALTALGFATASVLAPPLQITPAAKAGVR